MDRSSRPALPKDDDSWGKLASDLFGIDLGPQDDFDFAEAEPAAMQPVAQQPASPEPVAEEVPAETVVEANPAAEVPAGTDDYWGALETWDWNEGEVAREKRAPSKPASERGGRREDGDRRGSRSRKPREDGPRGERPRRSESARTSESASPPPAREGNEAPTEDREARAPRAERPRRSDRPRRAEAASASGTDRPRPPQRPKAPISSDDFGAGIEEEFLTEQDEWESGPFEEAAAPPSIEIEDDEFGSGINEGSGRQTSGEDEDDDTDRPKRRRRRRRRRPAGDRQESGSSAEAGIDDDRETVDEEAAETSASEDEFSEEEPRTTASEGEDRPRRRRRRRRRSGPAGGDDAPRTSSQEFEDSEVIETVPRRPQPTLEPGGAHLEEVFDGEEPEPIQRVNYDDVPTWDEAISYLVRVREGEPRGRGPRDSGSGNRGRRPPQRRPRSDAPPEA